MKVRILRSFATAEYGNYQQGTTAEMPEGADWIEAGHAEPLIDEGRLEQYHTEKGWYDIPGAEKKMRKTDAMAYLQENEVE